MFKFFRFVSVALVVFSTGLTSAPLYAAEMAATDAEQPTQQTITPQPAEGADQSADDTIQPLAIKWPDLSVPVVVEADGTIHSQVTLEVATDTPIAVGNGLIKSINRDINRPLRREFEITESTSGFRAFVHIKSETADADPIQMLNLFGNADFATDDITNTDVNKEILSEPAFVIGTPNSVGALPFDTPGALTSSDVLTRQWALDAFSTTNGIGLYAHGQRLDPEIAGENVRVVIFDTSPFTFAANAAGIQSGVVTVPITVGAESQMQLYVTNQPDSYQLQGTFPLTQDISSHGLFVAGLVYAVAPKAEIHLVQVLDKRGYGSTDWLLIALQQVVQHFSDNPQGKRTILNLSLGVLKPDNDADIAMSDSRLITLTNVLSQAYQAGMIVVASAGNNQDDTMLIPAAYENVIGVAASNASGNYSCFSNQGKDHGPRVAAPGGDAKVTDQDLCDPVLAMNACKTSLETNAQCAEGLVSFVYNARSAEYQTAVWMGTSFAAPLVSGLIALSLSREGNTLTNELLYARLDPKSMDEDEQEEMDETCVQKVHGRLQTEPMCGV